MPKARRKPIVIEYVQFVGLKTKELKEFCPKIIFLHLHLKTLVCANVLIPTIEGAMTGRVGDYIIKGVNGEFHLCRRDIFEKTYDVLGI
jgi:hypothetical protein|tara:strand:+ start:145 stop:411 length:267 start_codon:yes stop_codon:yes gene_type:complete